MTDAELIEIRTAMIQACHASEDAVQNANVQILAHRQSIRSYRRYARRVAKRACIDERRRQARGDQRTGAAARLFPELALDPSPSPDEESAHRETLDRLERAVLQLPSSQREAIEVMLGQDFNAHPERHTIQHVTRDQEPARNCHCFAGTRCRHEIPGGSARLQDKLHSWSVWW